MVALQASNAIGELVSFLVEGHMETSL